MFAKAVIAVFSLAAFAEAVPHSRRLQAPSTRPHFSPRALLLGRCLTVCVAEARGSMRLCMGCLLCFMLLVLVPLTVYTCVCSARSLPGGGGQAEGCR